MIERFLEAKILIIDDDEDDFIIISEFIRSIPDNKFQISWAKNYKSGVTNLAANNHDLYFIDYRLGARSGVDLLIEANEMGVESPIVLLTGKGNYEVDRQAMKLGAIDYLIKSELNIEKTERCIRYALDRAETMRALKKSEHKYRAIFENSKDIVFVTNSHLEITDINDIATILLGSPKTEYYGKTLNGTLLSDNNKDVILSKLLANGGVKDQEIQLYSATGIRLYCLLTMSVEKLGQPDEYVQGIIHDITNLKKAEKEALLNEKLAATGRLVRTLAHEIRNPLNNISMSAMQLKSEALSEDGFQYLDIINRNSLRIDSLLKELLNSSNPNDNAHLPQLMQEIMDDVMYAAADRLTLKKIKTEIRYPSVDIAIRIKADRENLKLALLNIVINAIEAMEESKGILTIGMDRTKEYAILTITDNGCGISDEQMGRIFDPFYSRKLNGAGLGLSFTLNILRVHNARVEVSSTVGLGSTFTVLFPIS